MLSFGCLNISEIMDNSPRVQIIKRRARHIYSTDEESDLSRAIDVPDQHYAKDSRTKGPSPTSRHSCHSSDKLGKELLDSAQVDTPSGSSQGTTLHSGSTTREQETIIEFTYHDHTPWDSELDQESDTPTPDFKRGKHVVDCASGPSDAEVIKVIKQEGMSFAIPKWIRKRNPRASLLILADAQLKFWPKGDKICKVQLHERWPLKRWNLAIKMGTIKLECNTVVLYLESTRSWQDVPPIKNSLHMLCKTIKNLGNNPRIFISNHLPRVDHSPVQYPITQSNFILQQAVRSVQRAMKGGVFELSMFEHFISSKGRVIKPKDQVFVDADRLTAYGCMLFRECLMHEAGIKTYWFDKK